MTRPRRRSTARVLPGLRSRYPPSRCPPGGQRGDRGHLGEVVGPAIQRGREITQRPPSVRRHRHRRVERGRVVGPIPCVDGEPVAPGRQAEREWRRQAAGHSVGPMGHAHRPAGEAAVARCTRPGCVDERALAPGQQVGAPKRPFQRGERRAIAGEEPVGEPGGREHRRCVGGAAHERLGTVGRNGDLTARGQSRGADGGRIGVGIRDEDRTARAERVDVLAPPTQLGEGDVPIARHDGPQFGDKRRYPLTIEHRGHDVPVDVVANPDARVRSAGFQHVSRPRCNGVDRSAVARLDVDADVQRPGPQLVEPRPQWMLGVKGGQRPAELGAVGPAPGRAREAVGIQRGDLARPRWSVSAIGGKRKRRRHGGRRKSGARCGMVRRARKHAAARPIAPERGAGLRGERAERQADGEQRGQDRPARQQPRADRAPGGRHRRDGHDAQTRPRPERLERLERLGPQPERLGPPRERGAADRRASGGLTHGVSEGAGEQKPNRPPGWFAGPGLNPVHRRCGVALAQPQQRRAVAGHLIRPRAPVAARRVGHAPEHREQRLIPGPHLAKGAPARLLVLDDRDLEGSEFAPRGGELLR